MKRQFIRSGLWKVGPHKIRRRINGSGVMRFEVDNGESFAWIHEAEAECNRLIASSTGSSPAPTVGDIHGGSIT